VASQIRAGHFMRSILSKSRAIVLAKSMHGNG
jgi:hypothetical protein